MKKALFVATIATFIRDFEMNDISILQNKGYEVHIAANLKNGIGEDPTGYLTECGVIIHDIPFERKPYSKKNINCYKQLKALIDGGDFSLVHCHTPVGGVYARLASKKAAKSGTKVIYTAHGLNFCKGSSYKAWLIYYPIEKFLSKFADVIITINREDYNLIDNKFHNNKTVYIPSVGIDVDSYANVECDRAELRKNLGLKDDDIMIFSAGELTPRKNHEVIIRSLSKIENQNVHYFIAGKGPLEDKLINLSKSLGLEERVHLLGFRNDVKFLNQCADIYAFPSTNEGLGLGLLEAMASGLPCVATNVQGIKDLIDNKNLLFKSNDYLGFSKAIKRLVSDKDYALKQGNNNRKKAKSFDISRVEKIMKTVYEEVEFSR